MSALKAVGRASSSVAKGSSGRLEAYGDQLMFYVKALAWTPTVVRHHRREVFTILAEIAPLISSIALAATVGCGYTARLGAMRISEEIDALESMGIPSLPYLVTTRMLAGFLAVIPLYVVALTASYLSPRLITTLIYHQSAGTYDHYFLAFLPPQDILWSFFKLIVLAVAIILIHCYYGYTASGGPAGVGVAVGRAIRTSIVTVVVADFFLSFAIWGSTTTVRITG
jgi:phospholipid/cholesterol/gamma-HCH transport system permease protein